MFTLTNNKMKKIALVTGLFALALPLSVLQANADQKTNPEKEKVQKAVKELKANDTSKAKYGTIQWTDKTEVKPLSGQKEVGVEHVNGADIPEKFWTVKDGDEFLITNVSEDVDGNPVGVLVKFDKLVDKYDADGGQLVAFSDMGENIAQSEDGKTYFAMNNGIGVDQTGYRSSDRTLRFVREDGKTPAKVTAEMAYADIDFGQALKTSVFDGKDDILLANDKWNSYENGVLRSNSKKIGINNIALEDTYTAPNGKTVPFLGYGYAQRKTAWSGESFTYSFANSAAVLDSSLVGKLPSMDAELDLGTAPYAVTAANVAAVKINTFRDVLFGEVTNNIVEVPAPNIPVLAKPKIPTMPTLKQTGYSSPTKVVLDDKGNDVDGKELANDAVFNWLVTQEFEFSGGGEEYSNYEKFKEAVAKWVAEVDKIKTDYEKNRASFEKEWNAYDKVIYPTYEEKWQNAHDAGAPGNKVAKGEKSDTSDLEIPEAPSTELENYLIGSFTIKDVIGTTNVNLSDKSEWFVEVSSDGEKYEKLDPKNYTLSEEKQEGKTAVTAEFNKDYVQSDEFYKTSYKRLSIGGQTFNLEGVEANTTISVPNVATSTVNGKDKDTNEVVVSTKKPDKKEVPASSKEETPSKPTKLPDTGAKVGKWTTVALLTIVVGSLGALAALLKIKKDRKNK